MGIAAVTVTMALTTGAAAGAATLRGTGDADRLVGTGKADVLAGRGGQDSLRARKGNDTLRGGRGRDTLRGGPGDDKLVGGRGADVLRGGTGLDHVLAGPGDDLVLSGNGVSDRIDCGSGDDTVVLDGSEDSVFGCEELRFSRAGTSPDARTTPLELYASGSDLTWTETDGIRYAAWERREPGFLTEVLDTQTGDAYRVRTPTPCRYGRPSFGAGLRDVGGGHLVWECSRDLYSTYEPYPDARIMNLETRSITRPAGLDDSYVSGWGRIGSTWLSGSVSGYRGSSPRYLAWGDGRSVDDPYTRDQYPDLDAPGEVMQPLCEGVRREIDPGGPYEGSSILGFEFDQPYGLSTPSPARKPKPLLLQRCGSTPITLSQCPTWCRSVQLGSGLITWLEGNARIPITVFAYDARTGYMYEWPFSGASTVSHTSRHVFIDASFGREASAVYIADLSADR